MISTDQFLILLGVSLIWGLTNPFIKRGALHAKKSKLYKSLSDSSREYFPSLPSVLPPLINLVIDSLALISCMQFVIPTAINLVGSFLYFTSLGKASLSIASPTVNALTLVFTACTGVILGEKITQRQALGIALVSAGVFLCALSPPNQA